ncbi:hypothetical protein CQZ93_14495 [Ochrobactrum vermis]|nr:hypothetical protein CQZ93_14495 [Ochrobactrum vermis]
MLFYVVMLFVLARLNLTDSVAAIILLVKAVLFLYHAQVA